MITVVTTVMVALITAIIGPIIVNWARLKMEKQSDKTPMCEALDASSIIDNQIENILSELECDRVWIAQFHNGGHFYPTGKSIQKFSIFYEKISPLIIPVRNIFQNIPTSLFPKTLVKLHKDRELVIHDNETNKYQDISYLFDNCKAKSLYLIAIEDLEGHFIGMISISYENNKHILNQEEWIFLRQKIGAIGSILTNYLNPQK
jgi:hypothetical protein